MSKSLPCIVCGAELENVVPEERGGDANQPDGGTAFMTHGHYGSTVFDPLDFSVLEITVCDPCMLEAATKKQVLTRLAADAAKYEVWRGPNDGEGG